MTSLSLELTVPAFLQVLRQKDRHNWWVQKAIRDAIEEIGEHGTKSMLDVLETETTNLLQNDHMDPSEQKILQEIISSMNLKDKDFHSIFCNEKILLSERLVDCLEQKFAFVYFVKELRKSIEASGTFLNGRDGFINYCTIQEYEHLMRLLPGLLKLEHFQYSCVNRKEYEKCLLQFRLLLQYKASFEEIRKVRICQKLCYTAIRIHGSLTRLCSFLDELKSRNLLSKKTDQFFVDTLIEELLVYNSGHVWHSALQCLVNYSPSVLIRGRGIDAGLPLHHAKPISQFSTILELGVKYFPNKLACLYHMNDREETPFEQACNSHGKEKVTEIVNSVLLSKIDAITTPESLFLSLAMDERIHFETLYTILLRNPSVLARVLRRTPLNANRNEKRNKKAKAVLS